MAEFTRPAQSSELSLSRLKMHYLDWPGTPLPVVLLHPNRTNARVWDFVVEASGHGNRFLAPDQRGHGLSEYPEDGYELDDYVADTIEFLDALTIDQAILVGAATGGNIALLIASQAPERIAALVVADPGLSLDKGISKRVQSEITAAFRFSDFETAAAAMPFSDLWSEAVREHYARFGFKTLPSGEVEWRYYPPGVQLTEARLEDDMWHRIDVHCPTLVMRGAGSDVFPEERMDQLLAAVPGAEGVSVSGCDHRISQDQPVEMAKLIDDFLLRRGI